MIIACDTETTGLRVFSKDKPFAIGIAGLDGSTDYVEYQVNGADREVMYPPEWHAHPIIKLLEDPKVVKVFHNAKFDLHMLYSIGVDVQGPIHDTMFMAKIACNLEENFKLKPLAKKYLGIPTDDEDDLKSAVLAARQMLGNVFQIGSNIYEDYWLPSYTMAEDKLCEKYCVQDCLRTIGLYKYYWQALRELGFRKTYYAEMRLLKLIIRMERRGVQFNKHGVAEERSRLVQEAGRAEQEVYKGFGFKFNINSGDQLGGAIRDKLKPSKTKLTPTGKMSVDNKALKYISQNEPVYKPLIDNILRYRGADKGASYFDNYSSFAVRDNYDLLGYAPLAIHPSFDQLGALTGRFSCREPNLQNVPSAETSAGDFVANGRLAFRPREGYDWYCFDYSQLEARLFASDANEEFMLQAFAEGRDLHNEVRERMSVLSRLPQEQGRKLAKNVGFCKLYGGGPKALFVRYDIPFDEGKALFASYDASFPGIARYISTITNACRTQGYITNAYGRTIFVDKEEPYKGVNYTIQSNAADLIKGAMLRIDSYLRRRGYDAHIVLQVHDELVIEINKRQVSDELLCDIKLLMEDHQGVFNIPTPVDAAKVIGNWSKKEKLILAA